MKLKVTLPKIGSTLAESAEFARSALSNAERLLGATELVISVEGGVPDHNLEQGAVADYRIAALPLLLLTKLGLDSPKVSYEPGVLSFLNQCDYALYSSGGGDDIQRSMDFWELLNSVDVTSLRALTHRRVAHYSAKLSHLPQPEWTEDEQKLGSIHIDEMSHEQLVMFGNMLTKLQVPTHIDPEPSNIWELNGLGTGLKWLVQGSDLHDLFYGSGAPLDKALIDWAAMLNPRAATEAEQTIQLLIRYRASIINAVSIQAMNNKLSVEEEQLASYKSVGEVTSENFPADVTDILGAIPETVCHDIRTAASKVVGVERSAMGTVNASLVVSDATALVLSAWARLLIAHPNTGRPLMEKGKVGTMGHVEVEGRNLRYFPHSLQNENNQWTATFLFIEPQSESLGG